MPHSCCIAITVHWLPHTQFGINGSFISTIFLSISLSLSISSLWPILYARLSWRQNHLKGRKGVIFFCLWSPSRLCNTCYPITATMFICFTHPLTHFVKYPLHFIRITIKHWVAHEYEKKTAERARTRIRRQKKKFK